MSVEHRRYPAPLPLYAEASSRSDNTCCFAILALIFRELCEFDSDITATDSDRGNVIPRGLSSWEPGPGALIL